MDIGLRTLEYVSGGTFTQNAFSLRQNSIPFNFAHPLQIPDAPRSHERFPSSSVLRILHFFRSRSIRLVYIRLSRQIWFSSIIRRLFLQAVRALHNCQARLGLRIVSHCCQVRSIRCWLSPSVYVFIYVSIGFCIRLLVCVSLLLLRTFSINII